MPIPIAMIADEVRRVLDLPDGYYVKVTDDDSIVVGNGDLAFAITRKRIEDGLAVGTARFLFPALVKAIESLKSHPAGDCRQCISS